MTSREDIAETLRSVRILSDVSADLIEALADFAHIVDLPDGEIVFRQGDPARTIYLVVQGEVSLEFCASGVGCRRILTVGPGELLGWSPVLEHDRLTATARALESTRLIALDGSRINELGRQDARLGYEFMKRAAIALAKRLTATRMQLVDVYGSEMPEAT